MRELGDELAFSGKVFTLGGGGIDIFNSLGRNNWNWDL